MVKNKILFQYNIIHSEKKQKSIQKTKTVTMRILFRAATRTVTRTVTNQNQIYDFVCKKTIQLIKEYQY